MASSGYHQISGVEAPLSRTVTPKRVIAYLDVDWFELQVRGKHLGLIESDLENRPTAVCLVITSANDLAKAARVERGSQRFEALEKCPELKIITPAVKYGKPENLSLKKAGDDIYDEIMSTLTRIVKGRTIPIVEKSTNDESYIDLTEEVRFRMTTHFRNCWAMNKRKFIFATKLCTMKESDWTYVDLRGTIKPELVHGAKIVAEIIDSIRNTLGFKVSAGVGDNKLLAKMACNAAKPNGLAVYSRCSIPRLSSEIPINKIPGLGGNTGLNIMQAFNITTMKQLSRVPRASLIDLLGKDRALEIKQKSFGVDNMPVIQKNLLGKWTCGKSYNRRGIRSKQKFLDHLHNRFHEMREYIVYEYARHGRIPRALKLEVRFRDCTNLVGFGTTLPFQSFMIKNLNSPDPFGRLREWKPILGDFITRMNEEKTTSPILQESPGRFPPISRINLIAYF